MTEKELEKLYYTSLIETHKSSGLLSVTSLVHECLRHSYYVLTIGDFFNKKTLELFFIGKAIHKHEVIKGAKKELELTAEGIKGIVDEYFEGTILDMKTVGRLPSSRFISPHYVKQLEYYAWLLKKNKYPVVDAWLLYIQKDPPDHKFVKVELRDIKEVEEEILTKAKTLSKALEKKIAPKRSFGWLCNYCNFASVCFKEEKTKVEKDNNKKET